jgi:hypothetical protein
MLCYHNQMNSILKYRIIALALVAVFGMFNVGIPVVIASCSMGGMMQGGSCPMCANRENPTTETFTTDQSKVCCTTTIVAERNTNEFVQVKGKTLEPSKQLVLSPAIFAAISNLSPVSFAPQPSASPPVAVDIPIFTSSLLI